jgi:O-antigen/teichoic acid export membrane protein
MASSMILSLASVPLALHYLGSAEEYGVWFAAGQAATYLVLIDAGITGAVGRFLIDHKDDKEGGDYGSLIKTGSLVLVVQGVCIAVGGCSLAWWLPALCKVPQPFVPIFRLLVAGQCIQLGIFFVGRMLVAVLQAHHRFDAMNYSQIVQLAVGFGVQWLTFHLGWGLYSLLAASVAGQFCGSAYNLVSVISLRLLPEKNWGRASMKVFKEVFTYGKDLFLLMIGMQLLNASQIIIIARTQGLGAVTVWSVGIKSFQLAFTFVQRIFDFSGTALGEMIVRGERERLRRRYGDMLLLTASFAIFATASVAVCNGAFVTVWTKGLLGWGWWNDALMGLLVLVNCVTRCQVGLSGYAKQIKTMRWIYFFEGISFAVTAFLLSPYFGIPGIILVSLVANLAWSGAFGFSWVARYLGVTVQEIISPFLRYAGRYLLVMAPIAAAIWWATFEFPPWPRLLVNATIMSIVGLPLLWHLGLTEELRCDLKTGLARLRGQSKV